MNKFFRNSLMAGVLAFGLAACGDDVTISDPPAPPAVPNITSFSVAPAAVTLTAGQVVQASYNLALAPGLTGTVAFASATSTVATVDANGKITAVAPGTAVITATATSAGQTRSATIGVTVVAAPIVDAITSFTVAPTTVSMVAGNTTQASFNLQTVPGVSGAVSWASSASTIASVNAAGMITAVAPGTAVITATATAAGQTRTAQVGVTVTAVVPASVSIQSVTQGLLTLPVNASNVNGQIEINLNFNPGGQAIDSIVSYIGSKRAAKQSYSVGATPAAGLISMSVNTANYTKNAAAGTTTVDFNNGPTTINAIIYPRGTTGSTAGNCANAPTGVNAVCSTNTFSIVLTNVDGWAADMTKPTNSAIGIAGSAAVGQTFYGGPDATTGKTTATLYPVLYTAGRSVSTVTWGIMGCPTLVQTALPFTRSWASAAATGVTACAGYEWTAGARTNVMVVSAIDNAANAFPAFGGLIANTVVFNSTPDSMRLDYKGPTTVSTPLVAGAEGFNWVNAAWAFGGGTVTDAGVSALNTSWKAFTAPAYTTQVSTGADLAESNTNVFATDGYKLRATGTDILGNATNSAVSADFGVDFVAPSIRYSLVADFAPIYVSGGTTAVTDSTTRAAFVGQYGAAVATAGAVETYLAAAAGTNDQVRTESIDNRSGLSRAITNVRRFAQGGATGAVTSVYSSTTGVLGAALVDGWRPAPAQHVTNASSVAGYYTTTQSVVDRAGNVSGTYKRTLALDPAQPALTGVSPNASYTANAPASFTIGAQDDLEVIDARLRIRYPNITQGDLALTATPGLVWDYSANAPFATRFDASIINPLLGTMTLDMYTASIQGTNVAVAAVAPFLGDPISTGVTPVVKPDTVAARVRDVFGSFVGNFVSGAATGVSTGLASPLLSATLPAVGSYTVTYDASANCTPGGNVVNGPCVIGGINFRTYGAQTATTKTFRATQSLSTTLPIFTRVDLFGLNAAGEWVYIQRIVVPASVSTNGTVTAGAGTITGSDNGFERFWTYSFTAIPTNTYTNYRALGVNASGFGLFSVRN